MATKDLPAGSVFCSLSRSTTSTSVQQASPVTVAVRTAPPPVPFSLVAEGTNEDGKGVDLGVGGQDPGKALGANPVALQVSIAEHHHKVLVGLLPGQLPDAGVGGLQRVVATHAELRVGVHGLQGWGAGPRRRFRVRTLGDHCIYDSGIYLSVYLSGEVQVQV